MNEQLKPSDTGRHVAAMPPTQHTAVYSDVFANPETFEHAQRVAKVFASSKLIPAHLQGNLADCLIALQIARRLGEEPLTVMQNIFIVSGRPGWYTSYVIARANKAGVFQSRITWETTGEGEALKVTAKAILADTGEVISAAADMKMAQAEGWTKNAKYKSMPEHMLRWRSAAMLVRLYAPEVMLGMPVVEELETMPAIRDVTPRRKLTEQLDALAAKPNGGNGSNGDLPHDPETGEVLEQPSTSAQADQAPAAVDRAASAAARAPSLEKQASPAPPVRAGEGDPLDLPEKLRRNKPAPDAADAPNSAAEYEVYATAWIANLIDPDSPRWIDEINMRNGLNLQPEVREKLKAEFETKISQLLSR